MTSKRQVSVAAVIVAAGRGQRAGGGLAKQWRPLAGARVIDHSLQAFLTHPGIAHTVIVLPEDADTGESPALRAIGGATRAASVQAGLQKLQDVAPDRVLIHDVARPCISRAVIDAVLAALDHAAGAAPALPVTDALWTGADDRVTGMADRAGLYRAQTPQGFDYKAILAAHATAPLDAPDDVAVARAAGLDVAIVPGDEDNLKITYAPDFARAARILEARDGYTIRPWI